MMEVMKIKGNLLQKVPCTLTLMHCWTAPNPPAGHHWPTPPRDTPGRSCASLGQSLVESLLLSPGSWCAQGFVWALSESVYPVLCKFCWLCGGVNGDLLQNGLLHPEPLPHSSPLLTRTSAGDTQTQFWLSLWVLVRTVSPFLPSCWASPLPLDVGYLFGGI